MSTPATLPHSAPASDSSTAASLDPSLHWKTELNARLRDHRARRGGETPGSSEAGLQGYRQGPEKTTSASKVAARVAERYKEAPSYQQLLAASATAAAAAADAADAAAHAAYVAAQAVFSSCHDSTKQGIAAIAGRAPALTPDTFADSFFTDVSPRTSPAPQAREETKAAPVSGVATSAASVEHHVPLPQRPLVPARQPVAARARSLVDAFAEAMVPAAQILPAKLIEFPRELVAPRRQRPRLAEGPLLEAQPPAVSLRIFEVGGDLGTETGDGLPANAGAGAHFASEHASGSSWLAADRMEVVASVHAEGFWHGSRDGESLFGGMTDQASRDVDEDMPRRRASFDVGSDEEPTTVPGAAPARSPRPRPTQGTGWGSIRLGEHPQSAAVGERTTQAARRPEDGYRTETAPALNDLAPISDRFMGSLIDSGIVLGCFLASLLVFVSCTTHMPAGKGAVAVGFLAFVALATFYGWLFMTYGGGSTPGMRYARIALCTFRDENPTRKDLQNRIPATALALLPLGLGVLWALMDEDKLGWHDRMTRTYQRSYR